MKKLLLILLLINSFAFGQVGIGNIDPKTALDITGAISLREGGVLNFINGNNTNVSITTSPSSFYRIVGPTAAFNVGTIVPQTLADGQILTLQNTTAFDFTIRHDISGAVINRILCPGSTNLILSGQNSTVTLIYNATQTRWIVIGYTDNPYGKNIQAVVGTTNTTVDSDIFEDMANMSITFTPKHNIVYLNFGASGDMNLTTGPQGYVYFRIFNVTTNTAVAGTTSLTTDSDGYYNAVVGAWNTNFSMFPVNVIAGNSTTLKIQWSRNGAFTGIVRNRVLASPDFSHRNLTIYD